MSISLPKHSSFALGETYHQRLVPTEHSFRYGLYYAWVDLDEVEQFAAYLKACSWLPRVRLREQDYLVAKGGSAGGTLKQRALDELAKHCDYQPTKVVMLGQLRCFGWYFSPVNFYLFGDEHNWHYLVSEVTNTPWGEKHRYCVDLAKLAPSTKAFHVSPFNPMDMTYHWQVEAEQEQAHIAIHCRRQQKEFLAGVNLQKLPMNQSTYQRVTKTHPWMSLGIVSGIYWQAFKLFLLKRVPFYPHPAS